MELKIKVCVVTVILQALSYFQLGPQTISGHMADPVRPRELANPKITHEITINDDSSREQAAGRDDLVASQTRANSGQLRQMQPRCWAIAVETRSEAESSSWQSTLPLIHSLTCGNYYNCISSQAEN